MKKIFIVFGHHNISGSFNSQIRDTFINEAEKLGHTIDLVNLFDEKEYLFSAYFEIAKKVLLESNTIIVPINNNIVDNSILAKDSSLGVRIPHHNYPINLCKNLNFPITTTSVNRAGENSLNDPQLISDKFSNEIDLIIDAGKMPHSKGSSVYKLVDSKLKLIR